eukprot:4352182-Prymnesium_polylepis.1
MTSVSAAPRAARVEPRAPRREKRGRWGVWARGPTGPTARARHWAGAACRRSAAVSHPLSRVHHLVALPSYASTSGALRARMPDAARSLARAARPQSGRGSDAPPVLRHLRMPDDPSLADAAAEILQLS